MENVFKIQELCSKYLAWCVNHRSPRTLEWYAGYLKSFLAHTGIAEMLIMALKPYHIMEWVDSKSTWGNTYKRGAIVAVQRLCNWACEMGYIENTPIRKVKKPQVDRREIYMKPEDYEQILATVGHNDPFRDFLIFVWLTGCRPQEARHIEPRHIDLENRRVIFPAEESKGKRAKRIIYLQDGAFEILKRLIVDESSGGKVFLNSKGRPWTKYAVCNRFYRISKVIGRRMFCYAARHGCATRKLIQGHDFLTVGVLLGHRDGSMLATVYSHIDKDTEHMMKAAQD